MPITVFTAQNDQSRRLIHEGEQDGSTATVETDAYMFDVAFIGAMSLSRPALTPTSDARPQIMVNWLKSLRIKALAHAQASRNQVIRRAEQAYREYPEMASRIHQGRSLEELLAGINDSHDKTERDIHDMTPLCTKISPGLEVRVIAPGLRHFGKPLSLGTVRSWKIHNH